MGTLAPARPGVDLRNLAAVLAILVLASIARLYHLGSQSFWVDEIGVTAVARSGHLFETLRRSGGPFEPPLSYVFVWAALKLPRGFETAARVPSALFGVAEVGALMLLAQEAARRWAVTLIAGILLAVAPFAVRYSSEVRYYTLFSALALLSWWLLLRAVRLLSWSGFVAYGVCLGTMALTHPFTPIVIGFQIGGLVVAAFVRRSERNLVVLVGTRVAVAVGIGVAMALPWYVYGLTYWTTHATHFTLNPPGTFAVALDPDLYRRASVWLLGNGSGVSLVVILLLGFVAVGLTLARGRPRWVAFAATGYVVLFVALMVPLAHLGGTYVAFRRLEDLIAPVLLASAIGVVAVADRLATWFGRAGSALPVTGAIAGSIAAVLVVVSGLATLDSYRQEKTNYGELATTVRDAPANASIVIGPISKGWAPRIRTYLRWQGAGGRPVQLLPVGRSIDHLQWHPGQCVVWITGSHPDDPAFQTIALNDVARVAPIAGDASLGELVLAWYVSRSCPANQKAFERQARRISHVLPGVVQPG